MELFSMKEDKNLTSGQEKNSDVYKTEMISGGCPRAPDEKVGKDYWNSSIYLNKFWGNLSAEE